LLNTQTCYTAGIIELPCLTSICKHADDMVNIYYCSTGYSMTLY